MRGTLRPAEFIARGEVENLPSETAIPEEAVDVVVTRKTPMSELLPMKNRMFRPPFRVERIGILDEGGIPRIERDRGVRFGHGLAGVSKVVSRIPAAGAMRRVAGPWEKSHYVGG
jgi:hypothetical protein